MPHVRGSCEPVPEVIPIGKRPNRQALIIYIYALPYRANNRAVVTVGKPNGSGPPARVGETYETIEC
jgi:hypothetical protein